MNHKKMYVVLISLVVSLSLVWCGQSDIPEDVNTVIQKNEVVIEANQEPQPIQKPVASEEVEPQLQQVEKVEEVLEPELPVDNNPVVRTFSAPEIIYAAKKWDSVAAHPAHLTVTLTMEDDIITDLDIDQISTSPKSARHQAQFAWAINWLVEWKTLEESSDVFLSVASTTSWAFNDAIENIQEQFNQTQ